MEYVLPSKDILEKRSTELKEKEYYNLSKLIYKKDIDKKLMFPVGIDSEHEKYYLDMESISGILVSGTTGSGKSMFLNSVIISLLLKNTPEELQFVFIDPRGVEFNTYEFIPHLYKKISTEKNESIIMLKTILDEIEERRERFLKSNVKNITNYNLNNDEKLSHIFVFIDEASQILEYENINEILEKYLLEGYKFGVHLILATSVYFKEYFDKETINLFKYIITFDLASEEQAKFLKIDDANWLTSSGDALVKIRSDKVVNLQTPYVSIHDIQEIIDFINNQNSITNS